MTDPKRWIDPASKSSASMRALLHAARAELPADQRVEEIGARIGPWLGAPPAAASPSGPTAAAAGAGTAAAGIKVATAVKLGVVAIVTLGAATGGLVESRTMRHAPAPVVSTVVAPPQAVLRPVAPVAPIEPRAPEPVESVEPPVTPITNAAPSALAPPARQDETTTEIAILEDSQDALQSNPARALAQVDRHAARFPHSALAQEREVIAIEALLRLGRSDEARLRAARFEQSYPTSAHVPRIEALITGDASSHNP